MMWSMLSDKTRTGASRSWQHLSQWVITNYLGNHWRVHEAAKFESMTFRQAGHRSETPYDYVLRRLFQCRMVTALPPNSQEELVAVMKNSPEE